MDSCHNFSTLIANAKYHFLVTSPPNIEIIQETR